MPKILIMERQDRNSVIVDVNIGGVPTQLRRGEECTVSAGIVEALMASHEAPYVRVLKDGEVSGVADMEIPEKRGPGRPAGATK